MHSTMLIRVFDSGVGFTKTQLSDVDLVELIENPHESRVHHLLIDFFNVWTVVILVGS